MHSFFVFSYIQSSQIPHEVFNHFDNFIFPSRIVSSIFNFLSVINAEGRNLLWNKTAGAIKYMAKHYANDYDYFMKADDDSYVIVENLRKILHKQNPDKPFIMGRRFKVSCASPYLWNFVVFLDSILTKFVGKWDVRINTHMLTDCCLTCSDLLKTLVLFVFSLLKISIYSQSNPCLQLSTCIGISEDNSWCFSDT
ncbi:unnamed protein product [Schistosoma curassoni]|uniref:N-acetylgalactosaminide beta-1,3-galactosyltransferase n=1 Tax=Schistosoma curassoni TaxID=6186 RepID=A0A183JPP3_9TREM|nr:unnamed protein product [Schistosoma curassoni]